MLYRPSAAVHGENLSCELALCEWQEDAALAARCGYGRRRRRRCGFQQWKFCVSNVYGRTALTWVADVVQRDAGRDTRVNGRTADRGSVRQTAGLSADNDAKQADPVALTQFLGRLCLRVVDKYQPRLLGRQL